MTHEAGRFDIAFGHCRIEDDVLVIDRADPDELGRWRTFWTGVVTRHDHQLRVVLAALGVLTALGSVLSVLLVDLSLRNPAIAPIVIGLGVLGLLAIAIPLEISYRRAARGSAELRDSLAAEFELRRPERVRLADITAVTVRAVSPAILFTDGHVLLVHYNDNGTEGTTSLGFPDFMADELATATAMFDRRGLLRTGEPRDPERDG